MMAIVSESRSVVQAIFAALAGHVTRPRIWRFSLTPGTLVEPEIQLQLIGQPLP